MSGRSTRTVYAWEVVPASHPAPPESSTPDLSILDSLAARDTWRVFPSRLPVASELEPLSREWYERLDSKRYRKHGRWLPQLLEFSRHANESIAVIGDGLGLDWAQFAQGGAHVTVIEPTGDRLRLYQQQFACRGLDAQVVQAPFDCWPISDDRLDVAVAVFHERPTPAWERIVSEMFRVLRPGGKAIAVIPAHFDSAWWQQVVMPWRAWARGRSSSSRNRFRARELREAFRDFVEIRVLKRHLRRSELPYVWRWMLLPVAERAMGRYLIVQAFKPLTSSASIRLAA